MKKELCVKLVIYRDYNEMHGQQTIKFCNAKQAKQTHQYKNIKTKLYKNKAAIWYNKTCRMKQQTPKYLRKNKWKQPTMSRKEECCHPLQNKPRTEISIC